MHRTGVMAPPTLNELPVRPGLMSPSKHIPAHPISMSAILWSIAVTLGAVELVLEISLP